MNASPSLTPGIATSATPRERAAMQVPLKWRIGQGIALLIIAMLAFYFNRYGFRTPPGGERLPETRGVFDNIGFVVLAFMVWMTTPNVGVIAITTLQEALRRRWMLVLLGFSILILAASSAFTSLQPGDEERFLQDFGLGFIITITLLMAIFLGVALVPPDVERRTVLTILSKPVNRNEFILGKFLGLCLTLALSLLAMGVVFLAAYARFVIAREGYQLAMNPVPSDPSPGMGFVLGNVTNALILHYGQLMVMAALALLLSLVVSHITAIVGCFMVYFGGQMSSYWQNLGERGEEGSAAPALSGPMQGLVKVVYYLLPRLDRFDVREKLVTDTAIGFGYVWRAWDSGLVYSAILLMIAAIIFSDREF